jgi:hypothetical protein
MKPLNKMALSGLLLLTAHSMSFAATYTLHITGSTAFRASTVNAIVNYLYAQAGVDPVGAFKGSNINGAGQSIFKGPINGGADTLIVEADWTGSCQGIYDTATTNSLSNAWMDPSNTMSTVTHATAPGQVSGGTSIASPVFAAAAAPDVTMSDVWQASTLFATAPALSEVVANGVGVQGFVICASKPGTSGTMPNSFVANAIPLTITAGSNVVTASAFVVSQMKAGYTIASTPVVSGQPNIPPFATCTGIASSTTFTISVAAAGTGTGSVNASIAYAGWNNITSEQCKALYTNGIGALPLSQFTGAPADNTGVVCAIGRSPDSGTRVAFTEEVGIKNETSGSQLYQLGLYNGSTLITDSVTHPTHIGPLPATTFDGVSLSAGDYGYTSGGQVQAVLDNPYLFNALANYFMVSPLGISDATNAVNGGATALLFNGVPYNQVNMEQGLYPVWSYEHMYKSATVSGQVLTSAIAIANQELSSDAVINGDLISNMAVTRSPITADGGPIFNNITPYLP